MRQRASLQFEKSWAPRLPRAELVTGCDSAHPSRKMNEVLEGAALSAPDTEMNDRKPKTGDELCRRKRPSHVPVVEKGNQSVVVFLTVCTKDRKAILARPAVHNLLVGAWIRAQRWVVGRYVVMPDHVHLFCSPNVDVSEDIRSWVRFWKSLVSRGWPCMEEQPIWQQDCWDTQLRRGENYETKWAYVRANPVRSGLVGNIDSWPFQGELNALQWHEE